MKNVILVVCLAVIVVVNLPGAGSDTPGPGPSPTEPDLLDKCSEQYRILIAETWDEFAETEFESDADALEWISAHNEAARLGAYQPFYDAGAVAAEQGPEFRGRFAQSIRERTVSP